MRSPIISAFHVKPDAFPNLTLKKIPKAVLRICEWDRDDYSLEVSALPVAPTEEERQAASISELPLFQEGVEE
jgi:adenine-specific DNA-methyltransferase